MKNNTIGFAQVSLNLMLLLASIFVSIGAFAEDEPQDAPDDNDTTGLNDLTQGGTLFRPVSLDRQDANLSDRVFWRKALGYIGAQVLPVTIKLDATDVIAPRKIISKGAEGARTVYPVQGRANLSNGTHVIAPFNIPVNMAAGQITSSHPAIKINGDVLNIVCVPVRLDAANEAGLPVPLRARIACGQATLLREEADYCPLILWLPIGVKYESILGTFSITPEGKITASPKDLAEGVTLTDSGLRKLIPDGKSPFARAAFEGRSHLDEAAIEKRAASLQSAQTANLFLMAHRNRSVFAQHETAAFQIIVPPKFNGGAARVFARLESAPASPVELGTIKLPATTDHFDSRLFTLDIRNIPDGKHALWVQAGDMRSIELPVTVVPFVTTSHFLTQFQTGCGGAWATDEPGLSLLHNLGLESAASCGFHSVIDTDMPRIDPGVAARLASGPRALPAEAALLTTNNDQLLERMLLHQIRNIDLTVLRGDGFYNEGLSYHHSYKPSVDRMVRHMQVFTQQSADYPSQWGVNYSWFPSMYGYVEGGVPTDAHTTDRNRVLAETLKQAGFRNPTSDERKWYQQNKFSSNPADRAKALKIMQEASGYWKASYDFGFGKHNKIYNDAIREVRPETAFTLFENAGHDGGKSTSALFNDMSASCYESYTDSGEWPMSSSFTTDWARAHSPGKPVWITVDYGTSSEGMMKSLFHAFGRGLNGGGPPMPQEVASEELKRRGKGLRFVSEYGAISAHARPEARCVVLTTNAQEAFDGRAYYNYHALYYHLTRAGYAPAVLTEEVLKTTGIPADTKALFVCKQEHPFEPAVLEKLGSFIKQGGKVVLTADCLVQVEGSIALDAKIKNIWEYEGFDQRSHASMWTEFETKWRQPLSKLMTDLALPTLAMSDPDHALVVSLDGGPIRYVTVMADEKGTRFGEFKARDGHHVSLDGTGWIVRDLVKQETLKALEKDGRTEVAVDLVTEPATILAAYHAAPASVQIKTAADVMPALGSTLVFDSALLDDKGGDMGHVPVRYVITDPTGRQRAEWFRAAGESQKYTIPSFDSAGNWTLSAQELLTGLTSVLKLNVAAAKADAAIKEIGDVHIVNDTHLRRFFQKSELAKTKAVIIEPGQEQLLPLAQKLVAELKKAGVDARVWQLKSEDLDTIPTRWYPRGDDLPSLKTIEAGNLVGIRQGMTSWIDKIKRAHIAARGGYSDIDPPYILDVDCILFSGGRLSESLRGVTPWMSTPNVPGKAQGRLVVCFSPFSANKNALAIVANDNAGYARAVDEAVKYSTIKDLPAVSPAGDVKWQNNVVKSEPQAVAQPFREYSPLRRVTRLLATRTGKAALILNGRSDTVAFVDETGKISATVAGGDLEFDHSTIDDTGRVWAHRYTTMERHPAWGYPTAQEITLLGIDPDGALRTDMIAYIGRTSYADLPSDFQSSFAVATNGVCALGRRSGLLLGKLLAKESDWIYYDDIEYAPVRDAIRQPRFPVGATFSPDSRFLLCTLDTRPLGWGPMHWPSEHPTASETVLLDTATGKRIWSLRPDDIHKSTFAVHGGFGAISVDGRVTAIADYEGSIYRVDDTGKILLKEIVRPAAQLPKRYSVGPLDGVGLWMSDDGAFTAAGYKEQLLLIKGNKITRVPMDNLISGCVSADGSHTVVGLEGGQVNSYSADGTARWSISCGGIAPRVVSVLANQTLVATSLGDLVLLDSAGKEMRRTHVAEAADKIRHELKPGAQYKKLPNPAEYHDPGTLALAQKLLNAKQEKSWKPADAGQEAFGKTFHSVSEPIELSAGPDAKECFVHLIYRRPKDNTSITIGTKGKDGVEVFDLDLPTPEFRIVDIPVRGPNATVTIKPVGAVEIAEASLWKIAWPGDNIAFVTPAKDQAADGLKSSSGAGKGGEAVDSILDEMGASSGNQGKMKPCKIWCPNPDIDKIAGAYLKPGVNPYQMVDGKRFGKLPAWFSPPFMGCWFTVDLAKPTPLRLVATYEHAQKQSEVSTNIAVFSSQNEKETLLSGAVDNDQFWRIFDVSGKKAQILGVHVLSPKADGLSEIEAYREGK